MVGEVIMNGRIFNAIVIEPTVDVREYRKSLINVLKVAVLNPQCELENVDIYNILDIIEETDTSKKGGEV